MSRKSKRKIPALPVVLIIIVTFFTGISGPVGNAINLPDNFKPWAPIALIFIIVILAFVAVWQYFLQSKVQQEQEIQRDVEVQNRRNRGYLLDKVYTTWIEGYLDQSLHRVAPIELGLEKLLDLPSVPWQIELLGERDRVSQRLSPGTTITAVYDEGVKELVILGEPGSGKTTLLLQLVRSLIKRAREDEGHPLPIVFSLSFWSSRQQSMVAWLIEEMRAKYQVPRKLGQYWIETKQVLPLLDGLDEVEISLRNTCVQAINDYRGEYGLSPIVVCCRTGDYRALPAPLTIQRTVGMCPLTKVQVDDYLKDLGEPLRFLRTAVNQSVFLQDLVSTPFMLSILVLTYNGEAGRGLFQLTSEQVQKQVFEAYVDRSLSHRRSKKYYSKEQIIRWLAWLAVMLEQHKQSIFYLESLQFDWLRPKTLGLFLHKLIVILMCGMLVGASVGALLYSTGIASPFLLIGLLIGLLSLLLSLFNINRTFLIGIGGVIGGLSGMYYGPLSMQHSLLGGLLLGAFIGSGVGDYLYVVRGRARGPIRSTETFVWSKAKVRENIPVISIVCVFSSLLYSSVVSLAIIRFGNLMRFGGLIQTIVDGLMVGLIGSFLFLPFIIWCFGLSDSVMDERRSVKPGQGIQGWLRQGIVFTSLSFVVLSLMTVATRLFILTGIGFNDNADLIRYIMIYDVARNVLANLVLVTVGWLILGGMWYVQHMLLRVILWSKKFSPWNYIEFLDYATSHILLYRVGGGYIFVHRMLLEYFASLYHDHQN